MFSPILIIVFPLLNDVLGSTKFMISVKPKGITDESGDTRIHKQVEETKLTVILLEHPLSQEFKPKSSDSVFHVQDALLPIIEIVHLFIKAELLVIEIPHNGGKECIYKMYYSRIMPAKWLYFGFLLKHVLMMECT